MPRMRFPRNEHASIATPFPNIHIQVFRLSCEALHTQELFGVSALLRLTRKTVRLSHHLHVPGHR
jgi:hypothetical protein